jgi:hypothetical protein
MYDYFAIFGSSMLKFIAGPLIGLATGTHFLATALLTAGGMMATVCIILTLGQPLRERLMKRFGPKKKFSKKSRRFVRLWGTYGLPGVAMLTPLVFSPLGGALLVAGLGGKPLKIFFWMSLSAVSWGFAYAALLPLLKQLF